MSDSFQSKIKVQLKLSISRLRMVQQKDSAIAKQQRRSMAQLLEVRPQQLLQLPSHPLHPLLCPHINTSASFQAGKEESARIRVENIIQSDIHTELLEILELYCELLLARTGLLESKDCDPGLEEAVKSLIYAAPRTEIKELHQARALLVEKYGKEFALDAANNREGKVADRVVRKLEVKMPGSELVEGYLGEIARTYGVDWPKNIQTAEQDGDGEQAGKVAGKDGEDDDDDEQPGSGGQKEPLKDKPAAEPPLTTDELSKATPPRDIGPKSPVSVAPPGSSTDNLSPKVKLPAPPELKPGAARKRAVNGSGDGVVGGKIPEVDELARRFAELKK